MIAHATRVRAARVPDGPCRGTTLAKTEILRAVWGSGFDGDPNIVEVYIGYLRRKIDLAPNQSMIRTVRGVGYSVRAELMPRSDKLSIRARLTFIFVLAIAGDPQLHRASRSCNLVHHSLDQRRRQRDPESDDQRPRSSSRTPSPRDDDRVLLAMHGDVVIQVTNLAGHQGVGGQFGDREGTGPRARGSRAPTPAPEWG